MHLPRNLRRYEMCKIHVELTFVSENDNYKSVTNARKKYMLNVPSMILVSRRRYFVVENTKIVSSISEILILDYADKNKEGFEFFEKSIQNSSVQLALRNLHKFFRLVKLWLQIQC